MSDRLLLRSSTSLVSSHVATLQSARHFVVFAIHTSWQATSWKHYLKSEPAPLQKNVYRLPNEFYLLSNVIIARQFKIETLGPVILGNSSKFLFRFTELKTMYIIIIIIMDLYSAFRSEDTEALGYISFYCNNKNNNK